MKIMPRIKLATGCDRFGMIESRARVTLPRLHCRMNRFMFGTPHRRIAMISRFRFTFVIFVISRKNVTASRQPRVEIQPANRGIV